MAKVRQVKAAPAGNPTPDPEVRATQLHRDPVVQALFSQIIDPVSSERAHGHYQIDVRDGPPKTVRLFHTYEHPTGTYEFEYRIRFVKNPSLTPPRPNPNGVVDIEFPLFPWRETLVPHLRDMWRCATIADPWFNRRFTATAFEPDDYQIDAVKAAIASLDETGLAFLLMATAAGKTEVFWMIVEHVLDQENARRAELGLPRAQIVFVVHNGIIHREAEKKAQRRFGGTKDQPAAKYTTGHLFGGEVNLEADILFATPQGLTADGRLEQLLESGRLVLIGFDETHHIVANTWKAIFDLIRLFERTRSAAGTPTRILKVGMTGTEERPDQLKPLEEFEGRVTAEITMATLIARGYAPDFDYLDCSAWAGHAREDRIAGTDEDEEVRAMIASPALQENTWLEWVATAGTKPIRTSLIAVTDIDTARAMQSHFEKQRDPRDGSSMVGRVIVLTGEEYDKDEALADTLYNAWKNRMLAGDPDAVFPEIIIAVNLFLEGADARGLWYLFFARDIGSELVFKQLFGRNERQDLLRGVAVFRDMVGLIRKPHIREALVGNLHDRARRKVSARNELTAGDEVSELGTPEGGNPEAITDEAEELNELVIEHFGGNDQSAVMRAGLSDVPQQLARRHSGGDYQDLSAAEVGVLHGCVAARMNFRTVAELDEYMCVLASQMIAGLNVTQRIEARARLSRAFLRDNQQRDFDPEVNTLRLGGTARLVHAHLAASLRHYEEAIGNEHLVVVLPEFSRDARHRLEYRALNLKYIRENVFGLGPSAMMDELVTQVLRSGRLTGFQAEARTLRSVSLRFDDDYSYVIRILETPESDSETGFRGIEGLLGKDTAAVWYIRHPKFGDKLGLADFALDPESFKARLMALGFVTVTSSTFWDVFGPQLVLAAGQFAKSPGNGTLEGNARRLSTLLASPGAFEAACVASWTQARASALESALAALNESGNESLRGQIDAWITGVRGYATLHAGDEWTLARQRTPRGLKLGHEGYESWYFDFAHHGEVRSRIEVFVDARRANRQPLLKISAEAVTSVAKLTHRLDRKIWGQIVDNFAEHISAIADRYGRSLILISAPRIQDGVDFSVIDTEMAKVSDYLADRLGHKSGKDVTIAGWFDEDHTGDFYVSLGHLEKSVVHGADATEVAAWRKGTKGRGMSAAIGGLLGLVLWAKDGGRRDLRTLVSLAGTDSLADEPDDFHVVRMAKMVLRDVPIKYGGNYDRLIRESFVIRHLELHHGNDPRIVPIVNVMSAETVFDLSAKSVQNRNLTLALREFTRLFAALTQFWRSGRHLSPAQLADLAEVSYAVCAAMRSFRSADGFTDIPDSVNGPARLIDLTAALARENVSASTGVATVETEAPVAPVPAPSGDFRTPNRKDGQVLFEVGAGTFGKGRLHKTVPHVHISKLCPQYQPAAGVKFAKGIPSIPTEPVTAREFWNATGFNIGTYTMCNCCGADKQVNQ